MNENINLTYYQRNRDEILNRAKDYYENDTKRLERDIYRNLSEEENKAKKISKKLS